MDSKALPLRELANHVPRGSRSLWPTRGPNMRGVY